MNEKIKFDICTPFFQESYLKKLKKQKIKKDKNKIAFFCEKI